jgi:small GTP-binding protein
MSDPHFSKVFLLGNSGAGKTSLLNTQPTIGCNCHVVVVDSGHEVVSLSIWDTSGQELYRFIVPNYVRDAAVGILVYDVTDRRSLQGLQHRTTVLQEETDVLIYAVGNEIDLASRATVSRDQGRMFVERIHTKFIEVSAIQGTGVTDLFKQGATDVAANEKKAADSVLRSGNETVERLLFELINPCPQFADRGEMMCGKGSAFHKRPLSGEDEHDRLRCIFNVFIGRVNERMIEPKQHKTKQNKTKQNKTKQNKTME